MARESGVVKCEICDKLEPSQVANHHHIHPRAFGGPDTPENMAWMCGSHHDLLHRMAEHIVHGRRGRAVDLVDLEFPLSPVFRERAMYYAVRAASAEIAWRESGGDGDVGPSPEFVNVKVKLSRDDYISLKAKASDHRLSVPAFSAMVLAREANS